MADQDITKMKVSGARTIFKTMFLKFPFLQVADLRRELKLKGLNTVGNKNELLERLQAALIGKIIH